MRWRLPSSQSSHEPPEAATEQPQQPQAATGAREQPRQSEQPRAATEQPQAASDSHEQPTFDQSPAYDPTKFVLGHLCPRGHEYGTTGQTLLRLPSRNCPTCINAFKREQRATKREGRA